MEIDFMQTDGSSDVELDSGSVIKLPGYGLLLGDIQTEEEQDEVFTKNDFEEALKKVSRKVKE